MPLYFLLCFILSTTQSPSSGAHERTRTADLVLTKDALYHLSYMGLHARARGAGNGIRTRDPELGRLVL